MEFTRKQYMAGKCCHYTYYAQFVDNTVRMAVERHIGIDRILSSTSKYFLDIPLITWINAGAPLQHHLAPKFKQAEDTMSQADVVCVVKSAARVIRAEHEVAI